MVEGGTIFTRYGVYRVKKFSGGYQAFIECPPLPETAIHHDLRAYCDCVMTIALHMRAHTATMGAVRGSLEGVLNGGTHATARP